MKGADPRIVRSRITEALWARGILKEGSEAVLAAVNEHGVPSQFVFKGVAIRYPYGPPDAKVKGRNLERLNEALTLNGNKTITAAQATVKLCSDAYEALWNKTKQPEYDPTPPAEPVTVKVEHVQPRKQRLTKRDRELLAELEANVNDLVEADK